MPISFVVESIHSLFFLVEIDMGSNLFYMNDEGMDWFSRVDLKCNGGNLSDVSLMSETVMMLHYIGLISNCVCPWGVRYEVAFQEGL